MGEQEINICSGCKEEDVVSRKYFYYDIKCNCCNSKNDPHFEIVYHCKNCVPFPPEKINVYMDIIPEIKNDLLYSKKILIKDFVNSQEVNTRTINFFKRHFLFSEYKYIVYMNDLSIRHLKQLRGCGEKTISDICKFWDFENKKIIIK